MSFQGQSPTRGSEPTSRRTRHRVRATASGIEESTRRRSRSDRAGLACLLAAQAGLYEERDEQRGSGGPEDPAPDAGIEVPARRWRVDAPRAASSQPETSSTRIRKVGRSVVSAGCLFRSREAPGMRSDAARSNDAMAPSPDRARRRPARAPPSGARGAGTTCRGALPRRTRQAVLGGDRPPHRPAQTWMASSPPPGLLGQGGDAPVQSRPAPAPACPSRRHVQGRRPAAASDEVVRPAERRRLVEHHHVRTRWLKTWSGTVTAPTSRVWCSRAYPLPTWDPVTGRFLVGHPWVDEQGAGSTGGATEAAAIYPRAVPGAVGLSSASVLEALVTSRRRSGPRRRIDGRVVGRARVPAVAASRRP